MFSRDDKVSPIRLTAAQYIILAIFLMLAYGLWKLQVMESGYYASAAEKNRIRNVPILAPRGKILDREGRIIVDNYPSFSALLLRDSSRDLNADSDLIAQGLHLDPNEVRARIRHFAAIPQYQPIFLKEDITPDELAFIAAERPWGFILFRRNIETPEQVTRLVDELKKCAGRSDVPVLIDQEGGRVQRLGPPHWPAYPPGALFGQLYDLDPTLGLSAARLSALICPSRSIPRSKRWRASDTI